MNSVERVKSICKERKIPFSKLEKDLGYSNGYIGQLRRGVFPEDRLFEIAEYLGLSVDYLREGKEATNYYFSDDAKEMAQFMFDNPEYKVLFDASRNVKKEDIEFVKEMIDRFTGNNK